MVEKSKYKKLEVERMGRANISVREAAACKTGSALASDLCKGCLPQNQRLQIHHKKHLELIH